MERPVVPLGNQMEHPFHWKFLEAKGIPSEVFLERLPFLSKKPIVPVFTEVIVITLVVEVIVITQSLDVSWL